jgi:hypothetical protein
MTDKLLREAAQNILNGIETGAIKIETAIRTSRGANALSALRSLALAQSEQHRWPWGQPGFWIKCQYP